MVNEIKKVLLAGLGSAAYTYEKSSKLIEDMVEKGKLTIDEGKELSEELKRNISEIKPTTKDDMKNIINDMNLVTKDDIKEIKDVLLRIEEKLK